MNSRLSLLAVAGALTLAGAARAADARPVDTQAVETYLAVTGLAPHGPAAVAAPGVDPAPVGRAAAELAPLDARVVALGGGIAVVHYTYDEEGADAVRVVTTVRSGPEGASAPARLVSHLVPGQRAEVSVAGAAGVAPAGLELAYDGGLLTVRPVTTGQPES